MAWLKNLRLNSINPDVRSKAVETLDGSGNSRDTDRIFASLSDESPQVRCAAIRALERAHNQDSVHSLIGALSDASHEVRESAARALALLRDVTSIGPLVDCLADPEPAVRTAAAHALQALAWMPVTEDELAWFNIALGKTAARDTSGDDADPFLAEPRSYPSCEGHAGTDAQTGTQDHQNLRVFLAGLGDANPAIRISAIHSLACVPGEEVTARILRLFRDRDPHVRLVAIQALAGRDDPAPAFFLGLLDEPSSEIRLAAIRFLGRIRHPQIVAQLLPLLSDEDASIRQATAAALGTIGDVSAVEPLVVSLIDEAPIVRQAAARALEQIDPNWVFSPPTKLARAQIEATFSICTPQAQTVILQVLATLPALDPSDAQNCANPGT